MFKSHQEAFIMCTISFGHVKREREGRESRPFKIFLSELDMKEYWTRRPTCRVKPRFKKQRFKKESRFKKDCTNNQNFST